MTLYLFIAGAYFTFLLFGMLSDPQCSKVDRTSWFILITASAFWIVIIPLSLLEIWSDVRANERTANIKQSASQVNSSQVALVKQHQELDSDTSTQLKNT